MEDIHIKYGILCNNSVYGGDCMGETMCRCKAFLYDSNYHKYYNTEPTELHSDYICNKCQLSICGCCYDKCPNCK